MRMWQKAMIFLARSAVAKEFMQNRRTMSVLSERFVGGEEAAAATAQAVTLKSRGCMASLFYLGEYVEDRTIIAQTVAELKSVAARLADSKLDMHVSVDPTQIGYQIDAEICADNAFELAREIKTAADVSNRPARNFLMLDMEDSTVTQATVDLYKKLRADRLPSAITLQAYLYRTETDLQEIVRDGGAVRLVKGAFAEGREVAFTGRDDIDRNFLKMADVMFSDEARKSGFYPIFGTHDERMVDKIVRMARDRNWKKTQYEFEMLYGVRVEYQEKLVRAGEQLRLYLPFGTDWWPYAVRRVGESPRNAHFLVKSLFGGRRSTMEH